MSALGTTEPAPLDLEAAMDAAWPALERYDAGGWVLRAAGGVTQRANSIWPRILDAGQSGDQLPVLLADARSWYRRRRLPVIFQLFTSPATAALHDLLDTERFTRQSETLVMTRSAAAVPLPAAAPVTAAIDLSLIELSPLPSPDWLRVWWDVDGRGGEDALATARAILEGCPSVYALARDADGRPAAVGRLALPAGSARGGLYCMATRPDVRRSGYGTAIVRSLLQAGAERGVMDFWLLVTAANHEAQGLYAKAGFREAGRYLYRQERPRRALTGC
ncbi:GNAT family N-acetyltransferase [Pseudarthrobacter sp. BRE9]|uniref:GNAT family N-acetyltransferase n=1 Tax=Pseudarthrobacter sp. BRE9 TaxID=2962582 RepID=UPI002881F1B8|nr:GNAT family N-acetyltransferase [Pseudarthrobacter sp. BRE9]MDT0168787.1 GNAT family N-acetyltransferase [Pseudarthrobacter sp. BRE9]